MNREQRALLGRLIKQARLDRGWRQEDLEEASGVWRRTIGPIEAGKVVGNEATLRALAEALDLPIEDNIDAPGEGADPDVRNFAAMFAQLMALVPASERGRVMEQVNKLLAAEIRRQRAG